MIPVDQSLTDPADFSPVSRRAMLGLGGSWLLGIAASLALIGKYEFTPGRIEESPSNLPEGLTPPLERGQPLLLMLAHPQCPCTRASLNELNRLLAKASAPPRTVVAFVLPEGVDDSWRATALRNRASEIRGVTVISDVDGALSRKFGTCTSGHTLFYDASGTLRFSGGITPSRGQEGESSGKSRLLELLTDSSSSASELRAPVYGCPLLDPSESYSAYPAGKGNSCQLP